VYFKINKKLLEEFRFVFISPNACIHQERSVYSRGISFIAWKGLNAVRDLCFSGSDFCLESSGPRFDLLWFVLRSNMHSVAEDAIGPVWYLVPLDTKYLIFQNEEKCPKEYLIYLKMLFNILRRILLVTKFAKNILVNVRQRGVEQMWACASCGLWCWCEANGGHM
jgi:hypothetical protein